MVKKRELLEVAERGDVETIRFLIHREVHLPHFLHTIKIALDDLLHLVSEIRNESERAKILKSLVETIFPGDEGERWWHLRYMWRRPEKEYDEWHHPFDDLHYLAHIWYDIYRETLQFAIQMEENKSRLETLLSLTRAFGMWFPLLSEENLWRFQADWPWHKIGRLLYSQHRLFRRIDRMETGYLNAKVLEVISLLNQKMYRTRDMEDETWSFEKVVSRLENLLEGEAMAERLNDIIRDLTFDKSKRSEDVSREAPLPAPDYVEETPPADKASAEVELEPPSRYADFTFLYGEGDQLNQEIPDGHTLLAKRWYQLEVAVRLKPIGIPPEELERHPIREPEQKEDVTIMVTAESDDFEIEEPVQTLTLPPVGDSTENARFRVRPLHKSTHGDDIAEIKVRLYYEFNLLEVAVIRAEVVSKFDSPSQSQLDLEKPLSFRQERLEREYLDLDNVKPRNMHIDISRQGEYFLFNFAFKNSIDKELVFTAPARLHVTDLEDDLISIRNIWYDIALSRTFAEQLEGNQDDFITNIRSLARAGRKLWIKLFKHDRKSSMYKIGIWLEKHPLTQDGIVQVSLSKDSTNFVFPWALIYDRPVPRKEYELPNIDGFWGARYCIEQHHPNIIKGTDEPVLLEKELKLEFMLWEHFRNAQKQKQLMENLVKQSAGKVEVSTPPITNAVACYDILSNCNAHVLYFYTHGYTRHRKADIGVGPDFDLFLRRYERLDEDSPLRETYRMLYESIKQDKFEPERSWIELTYGRLYLDELYDHIEDLQSGPFVILNMCESAQVTPSLSDSFIHFFLDRGAKGVIGTECPMTIEFAHPFAEKFLSDMLSGEQIGTVLLNARRHFLELKNPLGLAYTLFGSATLCFEPPRLHRID